MTSETATARQLLGGPYELGEGPHYDRAEDIAWWFDIAGRQLLEHRFASDETVVHTLPRMASVVARVDASRQMLAMEDGLYLRQRSDGALQRLVGLEEDDAANRSNDGRVHPCGALWIGTMSKTAAPMAGAIYWSDGASVEPLFRNVTIPNSICFSPAGDVGYFADSAENKIFRVALNPSDGKPTSAPETFLTAEALPRGGAFDGSVIDADGVLWNAAWGSASISGFAPTGDLVATFDVPANQSSCPCFVGPALDKLLVTTAWEGLDAAGRAADASAGHTFLIDGGFNGRPDADFKLAAG